MNTTRSFRLSANRQQTTKQTPDEVKISKRTSKASLLKNPTCCAAVLSTGLFLMGTQANAQTLARFAPADAVLAVELVDWAGVRARVGGFLSQFNKEFAGQLGNMFSAGSSLSPAESRTLQTLSQLVDREGLVTLSFAGADAEPHVLLVARPAVNADAQVRALVQGNLADLRRSGKVTTVREGQFPIFYGNDNFAFGYEGGLAYASNDLATVRQFLRRVGGRQDANLAQGVAYRAAMRSLGEGNARLFIDASAASRFVALQLGNETVLGGSVKLAPFFNMFGTLGRIGASLKFTNQGIETTTVIAPNQAAGDPELYRLLTNPRPFTPSAAKVVPADVESFSTMSLDITALYSYLSKLVDRTGLNPGGLDALFTRELGFDLRRSLLPYLGTEIATVQFSSKSQANELLEPSNSVLYISTPNEGALKDGLRQALPKFAAVLSTLMSFPDNPIAGLMPAGPRPATPPMPPMTPRTQVAPPRAPTTSTISGVEVTRYSLIDELELFTATKDGFLIIASSSEAMMKALAAGARLSEDASYQQAFARVPKRITSFGFADTAQSVRNAADIFEELIGLVASNEVKPSELLRLQQGMQGLFEFVASRVGTTWSWTEPTLQGQISRMIQPVRW